MLVLRRGTVVDAGDPASPMQRLEIDVGEERRPAVADVGMVGVAQAGDDVVVNMQARDLALGSGGFDVVHVNLTRGLAGKGEPGAHVMKLNYSSLQHAVSPVEEERDAPLGGPPGVVGVFFLHAQLAPACWALRRAAPGVRIGYVQTPGGALPGALSEVVRDLRGRELLTAHVTAGATYGGEQEAITTLGALDQGLGVEGWDVALCGPGPGILGSASTFGHGGLAALDSVHAAQALRCPTVVVPRMSSGDPRERHQGLSHHTRTVLDLLLVPAIVALPDDHDLGDPFERRDHEWRWGAADLHGYRGSGLPVRTMGRDLTEDPLFFAAALAGGSVLAATLRAA
jgi:Protein of unknown function (DUF3866)